MYRITKRQEPSGTYWAVERAAGSLWVMVSLHRKKAGAVEDRRRRMAS
jgi:hypothetical protein